MFTLRQPDDPDEPNSASHLSDQLPFRNQSPSPDSPTFRNATIHSKVNTQSGSWSELFKLAVTKLVGAINHYFLQNRKNRRRRQETYSILLMLYHPDKSQVKHQMRSMCETGSLEVQSDNSVYSTDPEVNAFLDTLTQLQEAEAAALGKGQVLADTVLAYILCNKDGYKS
jgi:hypothetical protein